MEPKEWCFRCSHTQRGEDGHNTPWPSSTPAPEPRPITLPCKQNVLMTPWAQRLIRCLQQFLAIFRQVSTTSAVTLTGYQQARLCKTWSTPSHFKSKLGRVRPSKCEAIYSRSQKTCSFSSDIATSSAASHLPDTSPMAPYTSGRRSRAGPRLLSFAMTSKSPTAHQGHGDALISYSAAQQCSMVKREQRMLHGQTIKTDERHMFCGTCLLLYERGRAVTV
eukprot:6206455-Pleurochrysis_carterae.AAC.2